MNRLISMIFQGLGRATCSASTAIGTNDLADWRRTAARHGKGLVERFEHSRRSHGRGDAVPVHVGPQVAADPPEDDANL